MWYSFYDGSVFVCCDVTFRGHHSKFISGRNQSDVNNKWVGRLKIPAHARWWKSNQDPNPKTLLVKYTPGHISHKTYHETRHFYRNVENATSRYINAYILTFTKSCSSIKPLLESIFVKPYRQEIHTVLLEEFSEKSLNQKKYAISMWRL